MILSIHLIKMMKSKRGEKIRILHQKIWKDFLKTQIRMIHF